MLLPASMLPLLHHYLACFCCTYSRCNYHLNTITAHAADAAVAAASMLPPLILSPHPTTDVAAFTGVLLLLLSHCCTCHLNTITAHAADAALDAASVMLLLLGHYLLRPMLLPPQACCCSSACAHALPAFTAPATAAPATAAPAAAAPAAGAPALAPHEDKDKDKDKGWGGSKVLLSAPTMDRAGNTPAWQHRRRQESLEPMLPLMPPPAPTLPPEDNGPQSVPTLPAPAPDPPPKEQWPPPPPSSSSSSDACCHRYFGTVSCY